METKICRLVVVGLLRQLAECGNDPMRARQSVAKLTSEGWELVGPR